MHIRIRGVPFKHGVLFFRGPYSGILFESGVLFQYGILFEEILYTNKHTKVTIIVPVGLLCVILPDSTATATNFSSSDVLKFKATTYGRHKVYHVLIHISISPWKQKSYTHCSHGSTTPRTPIYNKTVSIH